jgi:hypothetical protein
VVTRIACGINITDIIFRMLEISRSVELFEDTSLQPQAIHMWVVASALVSFLALMA